MHYLHWTFFRSGSPTHVDSLWMMFRWHFVFVIIFDEHFGDYSSTLLWLNIALSLWNGICITLSCSNMVKWKDKQCHYVHCPFQVLGYILKGKNLFERSIKFHHVKKSHTPNCSICHMTVYNIIDSINKSDTNWISTKIRSTWNGHLIINSQFKCDKGVCKWRDFFHQHESCQMIQTREK